jgi:hypothetical protein
MKRRLKLTEGERQKVKRAVLKELPIPKTAPKKPLNAYALFVKDKGAALYAAGSDLPAKEKLAKVGASLSAAWKSLPEHEKLVGLAEPFKGSFIHVFLIIQITGI